MTKSILTAALLTAVALAAAPCLCSVDELLGENLTKAEALVDAMADGPDRWAAFHEISAAQDDLLAGKMLSCAKHVGRVMKMGMMRPMGM